MFVTKLRHLLSEFCRKCIISCHFQFGCSFGLLLRRLVLLVLLNSSKITKEANQTKQILYWIWWHFCISLHCNGINSQVYHHYITNFAVGLAACFSLKIYWYLNIFKASISAAYKVNNKAKFLVFMNLHDPLGSGWFRFVWPPWPRENLPNLASAAAGSGDGWPVEREQHVHVESRARTENILVQSY